MNLILLFLSIVLVNNVITSQFLGICPFLGVSKKVDTAVGMGAAVTFVLGIVVAQAIFISITLPFFNVSMLVETFKYCFQNMITGEVLSTIIYLFGAIAAYMALKD